jgi:adenosine kinase
MKKNKVIILGSIAFDYIMSFGEKFVNAVTMDKLKEEYQSTITANSRIQQFGGTAGNISYNLGLLKVGQVFIFGSVGKDFENLGYKEHISNFKNINLGVDLYANDPTAACYIVNDIKSNQMIIFSGGALDHNKDIDLTEKIKDPENFRYAINSAQSVEAMEHFAYQLYELGIPMIFDPGQVSVLFPKNILIDIINKSEILIGNSNEIGMIKEKTELKEEDLVKMLKAVITTKGADGSELLYSDEQGKNYRINIPIAKPVKIEDATGAGDGYRAGILTGLILDMTLLDSCRLGSIIGSFVIETIGAQTQNFDINDVRKRFFETYNYIPVELENLDI